jgi:hypothetical protein
MYRPVPRCILPKEQLLPHMDAFVEFVTEFFRKEAVLDDVTPTSLCPGWSIFVALTREASDFCPRFTSCFTPAHPDRGNAVDLQ